MKTGALLLLILLSVAALVRCGARPAPAPAIQAETSSPLPVTRTPQQPSPTMPFTPIPSPSPTTEPSPTSTSAPSLTPEITATPLEPVTPTGTPTLIPEPAPRLPRMGVEFITHGDRDLPYVALTFDVGQTPTWPAGFDEGIYQALVDHQAPATFFLGGDWMRTHISVTRRLAEVPFFELGNHSWSHPDMRTLDEARLSFEVLRTQDMMFQITGRQPRLFRLPSGLYNDLVLSVVAWHGLYTIQWDVVTADPVPDNTAENILKRVQEQVQNGSIIVMHANGRGWHTAEALPEMIAFLRGEGYQLVTVSEMLGLEP